MRFGPALIAVFLTVFALASSHAVRCSDLNVATLVSLQAHATKLQALDRDAWQDLGVPDVTPFVHHLNSIAILDFSASSPPTVPRELSAYRAFLHFLKQWGILTHPDLHAGLTLATQPTGLDAVYEQGFWAGIGLSPNTAAVTAFVVGIQTVSHERRRIVLRIGSNIILVEATLAIPVARSPLPTVGGLYRTPPLTVPSGTQVPIAYALPAYRSMFRLQHRISLGWHQHALTASALSSDGKRIATASANGMLRTYDLGEEARISYDGKSWNGQTQLNSLCINADGTRIGLGFQNSGIGIVTGSGDRRSTHLLQRSATDLSAVAFFPDNIRVASIRRGNWIQVWDISTGMEVSTPIQSTESLTSIAISPDGSEIAAGTQGNRILRWNVHTGRSVGIPLSGHLQWVSSLAYSDDGHELVSADRLHIIRRWDTELGLPIGQPIVGAAEGLMGITRTHVTANPIGMVFEFADSSIQIRNLVWLPNQ